MAYSMSGSSETASNIRLKTSALTQWRNRLKTVFQRPNCAGRSRQGAPVRAIHRTASRNNRASPPVRPGSVFFPRQCGSILIHWASVRLRRSIANASTSNRLCACLPRRDTLDPRIREILLIIPHDTHGRVGIERINLIGRFIASTSTELRSRFVDGRELNLTSLTADIVSAYVVHNTLGREQLPAMISSVCAALNRAVAHGGEPLKEELKPAVPIKKSVTADYIFCLEDGKKFKSLKRHLQSHYDMSAEQYREKWGLSHDYPMVAPAYAAARSQI